jgi:ribosomal protein L16 Arg81 hydroxylase
MEVGQSSCSSCLVGHLLCSEYMSWHSSSRLSACADAGGFNEPNCPAPPCVCSYLTPAGSQGLAPHYDDVELWVVQTSGRKRWRLYDNVNGYMLPNASSPDFDQASLGKPCMEVELAVGDCLYMPRGTVHQAEAVEGVDSSHLTISTYQRCSFADLATHVLQVRGRLQ